MQLNGRPLQEATLRDVIRTRAVHGDRPMLVVDGVTLTYAEADERSNRIANSLAEMGVTKGDVVATYMYNSVDHVLAWFGCAKLGALWAPVNIALVNVDLTYTIGDTDPRVVIVDDDLFANYEKIQPNLPDRPRVTVVRGAGKAPEGTLPFASLLNGSDHEPEVEIAPSDPAGIIYTGGSTGMPKGVVVANLWYFPAILRYDEMFGVKPDDVHMGVGQMCHAIGSAIDVLCPMYYGLTSVMTRWFSASKFWDLAFQYRTTIVGCMIGPLMVALDNQLPRPDEAENPVRITSTGSGQVPRDRIDSFKRRFGVETLEIYGQTETGPLGAVGQRRGDPYHSLGKPHGWCEVMVVGPDDEPCPPGVEGQIILRPTVPYSFLLGYYNKPDKFAEACVNLWFHSGDIGHMDENGYLHFGGRLSHSIRRRGENISALEVEAVLLAHDAVAEAAVVGVDADHGDEDVKAYIQVQAGQAVEPGELIRFVQERIAYFKVPRYIEFIETMPRSATKNEIERFRLKELGIADAWDREAEGFTVRRSV